MIQNFKISHFKPDFNWNTVRIVAWNLVPLVGVYLAGWPPINAFLFYALDTIVIGLFNVFKLIVVYKYGLPQQPNESGISGLGIIPFFIVHYYFFVFVQLTLFFGFLDYGGRGMFNGVNGILLFIKSTSPIIVVCSYLLNNGIMFMNDFIGNGVYKNQSMGTQMFEPYPRIFVQQFVVILGAFIFTITGNGVAVLLIFILIKTFFDLALEKLIAEQYMIKQDTGSKPDYI